MAGIVEAEKQLPGHAVYVAAGGAQCGEAAGEIPRQRPVEEVGSAPKITVLVGHDSNIASLLTALEFKPYQLHDQNERTPIGGKIVFQRWHDATANRDLMKIEYVYQSSDQLRNTQALTLDAPPQRVTLALKGCPVDANGFCPIDKFNTLMREAAK